MATGGPKTVAVIATTQAVWWLCLMLGLATGDSAFWSIGAGAAVISVVMHMIGWRWWEYDHPLL